MKKILSLIVTVVMVFGLTLSANAALIDNGDGTVSDDVTGLMWLQDTLLGGTENWDTAMSWADSLVYASYSDWRLPTALNADGTDPCGGYNCTGSEMGYMYYTSLGNSALVWISNASPFSLHGSYYWTSTEDAADAWAFYMGLGGQFKQNKAFDSFLAWAVRDGDSSLGAGAILNNDFQTGDLASWNVTGPGTATVVDTGGGNFAAELTAGSPVTISQDLNTFSDPFNLSFDYWFQTITGSLSISLGSTLLGTISAPGSIAGGFTNWSILVTDPSLFDIVASLDFTLDGLTGDQIWLDNIAMSSAAAPVPEPGTWLLMGSGLIGLAFFRRRFQIVN